MTHGHVGSERRLGMTLADAAVRHGDPQPPEPPPRTAQTRLGLIVALSLAVGLLVAVVLVAAPFMPAKEHVLTGMVLLGFGLGWALLAVLSVRFSDQPQRWAAAPARSWGWPALRHCEAPQV